MSRKTRKLIWSAPLMAVFAVAGALALFLTLEPNGAAAQDAPVDYAAGSPLNVTVEPGAGEAKRTSLVIKWEAPTTGSDLPITGYRIDESTADQRWTHLADVSASTRSHTATGLKPATLRYYRVFALNRAGIGRVSEAKSQTTVGITEPSEVMNFNPTATGSTTIKLDWDPPADTGGARIIGYLIHWGTTADIGTASGDMKARGTMDVDGNGDGIIPILAPTTEWTHKGLDGATTRHYKIYAVNWYDEDMTSKQTLDPVDVRSATTHPVGQPAAPTGITAVPTISYESDGTLTANTIPPLNLDPDPNNDVQDTDNERAPHVNVYWYWPSHDGGADITTFRVEVTKTNEWPDGSDTAVPPTDATTALAGTAINAVMSVTADDAFTTTDTMPYQLQHTGAGRLLIASGSKLRYRVFAENGTGTDNRSLASTDAAQATATYAMTQTQELAPAPPTVVAWVNEGTEGSTGAKGETHHHDSVNLSWAKPPGDKNPTAYRVDVAEGTTAPLKWKKLEPDTRHADPTYDHVGWRPTDAPQTFQYRIFGKNGTVIGAASNIDLNIVDAQTAPSPVQQIKSATASASQIGLVWQKPANDGGTDIAKYCVLSTTASIIDQPLAPASCILAASTLPTGVARDFVEAPRVGVLSERAPETMLVDKGLLADTTYRYRVYAMNDAVHAAAIPTLDPVTDDTLLEDFDPSPSSDEDPSTTSGTTAPGAPTHLSAESAPDSNFAAAGARGVMVIWNAPADPAGAKVSGYEIQRKSNDGEFIAVKETSTRTTHITDTQPAVDEERQYRVRARNSEDWGPWSEVATMPLPTPSAMPPAALAVTASDGAVGTATITWQAISGATSYHVAVITDDGNYTLVSGTYTEITDVTVREHMFTGLTSGTAYIFAVIAETTPDTYTGLAFEKMTLQ